MLFLLSVFVQYLKAVKMTCDLCTVLPVSAICSTTGLAWIWKRLSAILEEVWWVMLIVTLSFSYCCWYRRAGRRRGDRGWNSWMASLPRWTWVWVSSGSWWWDREARRGAVHGVAKSRTWLMRAGACLISSINSSNLEMG